MILDGASFLAFHGTNEEAAESILRDGFLADSWFAFDKEVARLYGVCVFTVRFERDSLNEDSFDGPPDTWDQFHALCPIPKGSIVAMERVGQPGWDGWGAVQENAEV